MPTPLTLAPSRLSLRTSTLKPTQSTLLESKLTKLNSMLLRNQLLLTSTLLLPTLCSESSHSMIKFFLVSEAVLLLVSPEFPHTTLRWPPEVPTWSTNTNQDFLLSSPRELAGSRVYSTRFTPVSQSPPTTMMPSPLTMLNSKLKLSSKSLLSKPRKTLPSNFSRTLTDATTDVVSTSDADSHETATHDHVFDSHLQKRLHTSLPVLVLSRLTGTVVLTTASELVLLPKRHQSSKKPNTETPSKPAEPNTSQILPPRLLPGKLKLLNGRLLLKRASKKRPSVLSQRATVELHQLKLKSMLSTLYSNSKLNNGSTKSNNDSLPKLLLSTPELPTALPHGSPELTLSSPASRLNSMLALPRKTQRLSATSHVLQPESLPNVPASKLC